MAKKAIKSSGNVFLDLGFSPHEASVMLLRAQLAEGLRAKAKLDVGLRLAA